MTDNYTSDPVHPKKNAIITLIGKLQAKVGHRFIYQGPIKDCRECKLKNICFNLENGRRYNIVRVREKNHKCNLFEDEVRVVEVEKIPFKIAIPAQRMIEGSVISFHPLGCCKHYCEHLSLTHPPAIEDGTRIKILEIIGDRECEDGSKFKEALVDFAD